MTTGSYWERFQRQRITRRRLLAVSGAGAAGLAIAAACGEEGGAPGPDQTPSGEPVRGGRYKDSQTADFDTLDPVLGITSTTAYFPRMYNVLVNQSSQKPEFVIHDLAESYEVVGDDTYIFQIRPGVKIAPNTLGIPERDLDAEDAKAAFTRMQTDAGANAGAFTKQWIQSMEASSDGQQFTMKTKGPFAYFIFRIGLFVSTIHPKEFVDRTDDLKQGGAGAGPFIVVPGSFVPSQGMSLDRNVNYYGKDKNNEDAQLPYIDGIDVSIIPDRGARQTAFLSKQVYTYGAENLGEAEDLLAREPGLYEVRDPVNTFIAFTMNPTKEPWDDPRIRKAANLALNRQDYVDRIDQGEGAPNGLVHWPLGDYALPPEELAQLQPYDPEGARALIREATGQDTIRIKVMWPETDIEKHNQHLPIWLEQMEAAGFVIDKQPESFPIWFTRYQQKDYDASLSLNQIYESPDINLDFHHSKGPVGDETYVIGVGALEPDIDKAIDDAKKITDREQLVEEVRKVQRLIYEKGPAFLPIYSWYNYQLYWDFVKNIPQGLGQTGLLLSDWWLEPAT